MNISSRLINWALVLLNIISFGFQFGGSFIGLRSIDYQGHLLYIQNTIDAYRKLLSGNVSDFQWIRAASELGNPEFVDDKSQTIGILIHIVNYIIGNTDLGLVQDSKNYLIVYHLIVVLVNILTLIVIYKTLYLACNNHKYSLLIVTILNTHPLWFGHTYVNPRDTLLACGVTIFSMSLLMNVFDYKKSHIVTFIGSAIAIGTRLSIIPLIICMTVYWILFAVFFQRSNALKKIISVNINILYGLLVVYISNPQIWFKPWIYIKKVFESASNFNLWGGQLIMNGEYFDGNSPPKIYLITYFISQMPILYILIFVFLIIKIISAMVKKQINKDSKIYFAIGLMSIQLILIPLFLIYKNSTVYNGFRQFLFTIPGFIILISFIILAFWRNNTFRSSKIYVGTIIYICITTIFQFRMFPYNYVYYNEIASTEKVNFNWEKDYFGSSIIEFDKYFENSQMEIFTYPQNVEYGIDLVTGGKYTNLPKNQIYGIINWEDINLEGLPINCSKSKIVQRNLYGQRVDLSYFAVCMPSTSNYNTVVKSYYFEDRENNKKNNLTIVVKNLTEVNKIYSKSLCSRLEIQNEGNSKVDVKVKDFSLILDSGTISANRHSFLLDEDSARGNQLTKIFEAGDKTEGVICFDGEKINWSSRNNSISYQEISLIDFDLKI